MGLTLPAMREVKTRQDGVTAFAGYNHNLRLRDNEFYDMRNISSASLPVVTARERRLRLRKLNKPNGLFAHEKLCWVDGTDFYYDGIKKGDVTDDEKQFVRMGAYVLIWPDKAYYNTHTDEYGCLEARKVTDGTVQCQLCRPDGTLYTDYTVADTAPGVGVNGALWMDTSATPNVLRQFVAVSMMWTSIPSVYTKITASGIGADFKSFDGVTISGCTDEALNGDFYLIDAGNDFVIVTALIRQAFTQTAAVTIAREIPDMDFIVESANRIWGCSSEKHEIYASVLGDAKNWNTFAGLSTDSYAMTVGSGGRFTGACAHLGDVLFFKEDMIHRMMGTKPANFQLTDTACRGVGTGNDKSICTVNETLYYRSAHDVCAFGAALPGSISLQLGAVQYSKAVGGVLKGRYYLCMAVTGDGGGHALLVYDTNTGVWCKEDDVCVRWFAAWENDLYFVDGNGYLWSVGGTNPGLADDSMQWEGPVAWMLETGDLGLDEPNNKYIAGMQLHVGTDIGTTVRVELQHDATGAWQEVFRRSFPARGSATIPVIPRRCRTLRMRLRGEGGFTLYAITKRTQAGSDVYGTLR